MRAKIRIGTVHRFDDRRPIAIGRCLNCGLVVYRFSWSDSDPWLHSYDDKEVCHDWS